MTALLRTLRLGVSLGLALAAVAQAQERPYIGFVYPAGGQQGATAQIRLGGQGLDGVHAVLVTGTGVVARVTDYYRRFDDLEMRLVNEQLRLLRREVMSDSARAEVVMAETPVMTLEKAPAANQAPTASSQAVARNLIDKIEKRTSEYVLNPACPAISSLVLVEVAIAPDAEPGEREIRLVTLTGVSNPLGFHVGQVPERSRQPMVSATQQVLGKEAQALAPRVGGEVEDRIAIPCTVNGQISSGEMARYRFEARQGQRLVISTLGRQLVPFIADAVPGWFQPVLALYDADGRELAYADDYRFKPDPTIFYQVPADGEYVLAIRDSLYRGREDFVYRTTIGELPFVTSLFPLGGTAGGAARAQIKGWNVDGAELEPLRADAAPGVYYRGASRKAFVSNRVPFAVDTLPEGMDQEPNNTPAKAQPVTLPIVLNGRIDQPDDWDVFQFSGKANDEVVVEVQARRLDSPLDSVIKLTDATGRLLALNDDCEDLTAGLNTHQADSYLLARLPADGKYYVHLGDAARQGGDEFGYRLRISAPRPDFALRIVPSSLGLRSRSSGTFTVYAMRRDGFTGPIQLGLKEPMPGFSIAPVTMASTQTVARLTLQTELEATREPVSLAVAGTATVGGQAIVRPAVPAEDRMQAFLWRQLIPAKDLKVLVFDPAYRPPPKRVLPARRPALTATNAPSSSNLLAAGISGLSTNKPAGTNAAAAAAAKPRPTAEQIAGRMRELNVLFEEGMFTDAFYLEKVAELEAGD